MLCDFKLLPQNKEWICTRCGRRSIKNNNSEFMPTAKCRLPEFYHLESGYIFNEKIVGVGDTLSSIIKKMGYSYPPISSARTALTYLNKKGVGWCEKNQDLILQWLKYECKIYNIKFLDLVGKAIIRLAIRKAKHQFSF